MYIEKIRENNFGLIIDVTSIDIFSYPCFILDDDVRWPRFKNMAKLIVRDHKPEFSGELVQVHVSEYLGYYTRYTLLLKG